ncbi:MAG TPA: exonuclease [candidate division CPR3 bacterium]|uniref:Exonuclease n=1 Tax=candidate division CPR3 bacterium TaxID=2268181 RepID=A0A7C1NSL5_UNCC3|nr:exonuclease [candidate division CPR3 bacterium]
MPTIVDCEQNSEQWWAEKLGKPSASKASVLMANIGKPDKQRKLRNGYLYELVGEIITQQRVDGYQNINMLVGKERETESRMFYEMVYGVKVEQVGVVYKDEKKECLCSPDGLINREYGLEMKNVLPKTQVKYLLENKVPSEYLPQIQFSLYVTGFKFWDFFSYSPGLRPLIIRVTRDKKFIEALEAELKAFCKELKEVVRKIR